MSTITHPVLLIMAQRLASIIIKTGAKLRILFQTWIELTRIIVILGFFMFDYLYLFRNNVYLCIKKNEMMVIVVGEHLFPFRTEKLSLFTPMVLQ